MNSDLTYSKDELVKDNPDAITEDGEHIIVRLDVFFAMLTVINVASRIHAILTAMEPAHGNNSGYGRMFARGLLNVDIGLGTALDHLDEVLGEDAEEVDTNSVELSDEDKKFATYLASLDWTL